jgi:hypothetical protein
MFTQLEERLTSSRMAEVILSTYDYYFSLSGIRIKDK